MRVWTEGLHGSVKLCTIEWDSLVRGGLQAVKQGNRISDIRCKGNSLLYSQRHAGLNSNEHLEANRTA